MTRFTALAVVAALSARSAFGVEIETTEIKPGRFTLTLTSDSVLDEAAAQRLLLPKAIEICGAAQPLFGRYTFDSNVPIDRNAPSTDVATFQFKQAISCGVTPTEPLADDAGRGVLRPVSSQDLKAFVEEISVRHLTERSEGRFEESYAVLSRSMGYSSLDEWRARNEEFRRIAGRLKSVSVWRVTIYDNPPNAPKPGVYIAADYENAFDQVPIQCGYLMWFQSSESGFVITREETGSIPLDMLAKIRPDQLSEVRRQLRCPAR